MMFMFDFADWRSRRTRRTMWPSRSGWLYYTLTFLVNGLPGILLVSTFDITFEELAGQESAPPVRIVNLTNVVGLGLIAATQMRMNMVNLYLASTTCRASSRPHLNLPRTVLGRRGLRISFLMMLTNIFSYVLDAPTYQGIVIGAWVAVALAHVWYLRARPATSSTSSSAPGASRPSTPAASGLGHRQRGRRDPEDHRLDDEPVLRCLGPAADVRARLRDLHGRDDGGEAVPVRDEPPGDPALEVDDPCEARVRCHACDRSYIAEEMDRDPTAGHQAICASARRARRSTAPPARRPSLR